MELNIIDKVYTQMPMLFIMLLYDVYKVVYNMQVAYGIANHPVFSLCIQTNVERPDF